MERATRLFEEMTAIPGDEDSWILVTTTAGFTGESTLLESLYQRGLAGQRVDQELELYEAEELFMFRSHTPRQPWQTSQYYVSRRRILRQITYLRLHEDCWTTSEGTFLIPDLWDPCGL